MDIFGFLSSFPVSLLLIFFNGGKIGDLSRELSVGCLILYSLFIAGNELNDRELVLDNLGDVLNEGGILNGGIADNGGNDKSFSLILLFIGVDIVCKGTGEVPQCVSGYGATETDVSGIDCPFGICVIGCPFCMCVIGCVFEYITGAED